MNAAFYWHRKLKRIFLSVLVRKHCVKWIFKNMHFLQYFLSILLASCNTRLRSINFTTCKLNCFTFKIILLSWDFLNRSWKFQPSDSWTITRGKNIISHQFRLSISIESWFTTIYKPSSKIRFVSKTTLKNLWMWQRIIRVWIFLFVFYHSVDRARINI